MPLTAPKKTWGGQWFTQVSFFVATFVTGGQESASKSPTFLSCKTLASISMKKPIFLIIFTVSTMSIFSQSNGILQGIYLDDRDKIEFHQDSITFSIMSNGGFIFPMEGYGQFTQSDDILIVRIRKNAERPINKRKPSELGDREFIEDKTLVFKIHKLENDSLKLSLIGVIGNSDFRERQTVKRFERENRKFRFRERQLTRRN